MNRTLIILILLIGIKCNSQNFEGIITYKVEIENPNPNIVSDSVFFSRAERTFIQKYYFKENKYKSVTAINGEKEIELYDPIKQRLYTYDQDEDIASWTDTTKRLDEIVEIKKSERTFELLGLNCKALGFSLKNGIMFFAYSDDIALSAELFEGHKYDYWWDFLSRTNAIPLKIKVSTPFSNRTLTAIDIERTKLSDDEFKVPEFEQTIESVN